MFWELEFVGRTFFWELELVEKNFFGKNRFEEYYFGKSVD